MLLVRLHTRTLHSHNEMELGLVLDGKADLICANSVRKLNPGDMYVLNPMEQHGIRAGEEGVLILAVQISRQLATSFFQNAPNVFFVESAIRTFFVGHETRYEIMKGLMIELGYHYFSQLSNYEYKCMSLLNMIIYIINSYVPKRTLSDSEISEQLLMEKRLQRITDYIEQNFSQKLLLSEIAAREGLTLTYLSHFFKENIGMPFQEYLNRKRFEHACNLLRNSEKKVLTISIESGFSDVRYLNNLCQKYCHCSATELRKRKASPDPAEGQIEGTVQSIYTPSSGILYLNTLREVYRSKYSGYTIWEFYR